MTTERLFKPADAIRWVLYRRMIEPDFMPKFPFTLNDLRGIDPASAAAIDHAFNGGVLASTTTTVTGPDEPQ